MIKYLMIIVLSFYSTMALSCDICGCGLTARSFGILPQFSGNFIGLRAQYRSFDSEHPPLFASQLPEYSSEYYYNAEIWGRWNPVKHLQLFYFIPYQRTIKLEEGHRNSYSGLGDISLMANYILINTVETEEKSWKHALQAGGGIKIPTGRYDIPENDGSLIMNVQPGTGAFAIPINLIYTIRRDKIGLNTEGNYTFNLKNKNDFQFGDRSHVGMKLFFWQEWKNISILPAAGLNYQHAAPDNDVEGEIYGTGGNSVNASISADLYYKRMALGFNAQLPVSQHMTDGNVRLKENFSTTLIYNF